MFKGAVKSILDQGESAEHYHGNDGLGDMSNPVHVDVSLIQKEHAVNALLRLVNDNPGNDIKYIRNTHPEHLSSHSVFCGVLVSQFVVLCVCFVEHCLSFCPFSVGYCVVCPSWILRILITHLISSIFLVFLVYVIKISFEWNTDLHDYISLFSYENEIYYPYI